MRIHQSAAIALTLVLGTAAGAAEPSYLEPGFPVGIYHGGGSGWAWDHTPIIANLDEDPELELVFAPTAVGAVLIVDSDGRFWPNAPLGQAPYDDGAFGGGKLYAFGEFDPARPGLELAAAMFPYGLYIGDMNDSLLPGWPWRDFDTGQAQIDRAPMAVDLDGDGVDEVVVQEFRDITAFDAHGQVLPGFPFRWWPEVSQCWDRTTGIAAADLDGDGSVEIVAAKAADNPALPGCLVVMDAQGRLRPGFPVRSNSYLAPVILQADGDPDLEILTSDSEGDRIAGLSLKLWDHDGSLVRSIAYPGWVFTVVPADMDRDGVPELVVSGQRDGNGVIDVITLQGANLPGWPYLIAQVGPSSLRTAQPVIGDIDGDGAPEIIHGPLILDRHGQRHPFSPLAAVSNVPDMWLSTFDGVAIADIDLDGRNELAYEASGRQDSSGFGPPVTALSVFDLGGPAHGPVLVAMHRGDHRRTNVFRGTPAAATHADLSISTSGSTQGTPIAPGQEIRIPVRVELAPGSDPTEPYLTIGLQSATWLDSSNPAPTVDVLRVEGGGLACETRAHKTFCTPGLIQPGTGFDATVVISADRNGVARLAFAVDSQAAESNLADNYFVVERTISSADIVATMSIPTVVKSSQVLLTFGASNQSSDPAVDVVVKVPIPTKFKVKSLSVQGGTCVTSTTEIVCRAPTMRSHGYLAGTVHFKPNKKGYFNFGVSVSASTPDPNPANNAFSTRVRIK